MKKQAYTMIAMVVLWGCLTVSAKAQYALSTNVKIPFQFGVANRTLPAGEYEITCLNGLLTIRKADGKVTGVMTMVNQLSNRSQDKWELLFNRYGSRYFLVQAWAGRDAGVELPTTSAERAVQHDMTRPKPKTETVALKLRYAR